MRLGKGSGAATTLLRNQLTLLVESPVKNVFFERHSGGFLLHAFFSRCVMIGYIHPRSSWGPDRGDRHSFTIERM